MSKEKEIKSHVVQIFKHGKVVLSEDSSENTEGHVKIFPDVAYAEVSTHRSTTVNLGDYNSVQASVSITVPCLCSEQDMEGAYDYAATFCEARIAEINSKVKRK